MSLMHEVRSVGAWKGRSGAPRVSDTNGVALQLVVALDDDAPVTAAELDLVEAIVGARWKELIE